jgi:uncharacterized protein (UPF0335 family)
MMGASANAIRDHLSGRECDGSYPHDSGDFERCEAFLHAHPEWAGARFEEMAEVNAYWRALVALWPELSSMSPEARSQRMKAVLRPIEDEDPSCGIMPGSDDFKDGVRVTVRAGGKIDFQGNAPRPDDESDLFSQAVMIVWNEGKVSTSFIQRRLEIGYNSAARLIERMEEMAIVSKPNHIGKREVRSPDDLRAALNIRQEITDIAGDEAAPILLKALVAGLKSQQEAKPMSGQGHNSGADAYSVTADELRQFIERFEQLESEKKDVAEQQKELMAEAKGRGYDTKVMKKVVALRKRKPDDIAEEEAITEMYKAALGMI